MNAAEIQIEDILLNVAPEHQDLIDAEWRLEPKDSPDYFVMTFRHKETGKRIAVELQAGGRFRATIWKMTPRGDPYPHTTRIEPTPNTFDLVDIITEELFGTPSQDTAH